MAIKGKSKPRARRSVTPGPRPVYVPVKRPLVQRRGFQIGVAAVVALAAVAAIAYGFLRERDQSHERAQKRTMRTVSSAYDAKIQTAIAGAGQPQPPSSFILLPELKTDIDGLRSGSVGSRQAATDAASLAKRATDAADALADIQPADMVRGKGIEDAAYVLDLINAPTKMEDALRMEAVAAHLLGRAAEASGADVEALLKLADEARTTAETMFASGYSDWVNARVLAGTFEATMPTSPGG